MGKALERKKSDNTLSHFKYGSYQATFNFPKKPIEKIAVLDLMEITYLPSIEIEGVKKGRPISPRLLTTTVKKTQPTAAERRKNMREAVLNRQPSQKMDIDDDVAKALRKLSLS